MKYSPEIFARQFPIVKRFVYHLTYYRCLFKGYQSSDYVSEFWTHTIDAHLLQATISWCKVFGSDGSNDTHWKRLNKKENKQLQACFLEGLNTICGIGAEEWIAYWKEIINFRNKYVAHSEIGFVPPIPNFDRALEVAFFYDKWIRKIIRPDHLLEGSLKLFSENLTKKIENPLASIIVNSKTVLDGI